MDVALAVAWGYLAGSIPFAYLLARRRGLDLRVVGSGNVGASNVLRTSGARDALLALVLDGAKGGIAVAVAQQVAGGAAPVAAGVGSIIGHIYSVWLGFRGGRGVATAAGVFAVLTPMATALAACVFVAVVAVTRYVSVGSIAGTLTLATLVSLGDYAPAVVGGVLTAGAVIVYAHRGNVARIAAGTERRIGQRLV